MPDPTEVVATQPGGLVYLRCADCRELVGLPGGLIAMDHDKLVAAIQVELQGMVDHAAAELTRHPSVRS